MARRRKPPANVSEVLLSGRATPRIEALYCLIVRDEFGVEGIVRRDTPVGTIPWITDDADMIGRMREMARAQAPFAEAEIEVAHFARVNSIRKIERPVEPVPDPGPPTP